MKVIGSNIVEPKRAIQEADIEMYRAKKAKRRSLEKQA
jgi:hypothetical protein